MDFGTHSLELVPVVNDFLEVFAYNFPDISLKWKIDFCITLSRVRNIFNTSLYNVSGGVKILKRAK